MDNGASSYRRFLEGNEDGIVEIIRDHKDGLMLYLNGYVQNIHIAEELTEDTFVKLVVKKPKFSEKSTFKTWLYSIGRNIAVDYMRRNPKGKVIPLDEIASVLNDEENVLRAYIQNEQKIFVHKALKRLNPEYRRVLYLVYFENFQNSEVAAIMKKSKKQIQNLIYRGKQALRLELEKEGFVYEEL